MEITSKVDAVLKGLKRIGVKNEGINYQLGPDELVEQVTTGIEIEPIVEDVQEEMMTAIETKE